MKVTERLSDYIFSDIRDYVRGSEDDEEINDIEVDKIIEDMSNNEIFRAYLEWNGIIGFDDYIKKAVEGI